MAKGARAEMLNQALVDRVSADIGSALRRRPAHEPRLAGVIRALAPLSPAIQAAVADATATLIRRGSFDRHLYMGSIRALADSPHKKAASLVGNALLGAEDAGGLSTLCAAGFVKDGGLADALARVATSRHPHVAFAAEIARAARGECDGTHLMAIAPKIKESHRIAMCVEVFVPHSRAESLPSHVAPALTVLRDAERHLGRWLILAEVATRAQDPKPLLEAQEKAQNGPSSARSAWTLVAWALDGKNPPPPTRPTVELVARLSDRPSADRDTTFLFRLAAAGAPSARTMLEAAVKTMPIADEIGVRSACFLLRDHERRDLRDALVAVAKTAKREDLRGMAMAALWDAGHRDAALTLAKSAQRSRSLPTAAWAGLVRLAEEQNWDRLLVDEPTFRRLQWGWVE
ncbi:MAG: hypothetical protein ACOC1F_02405 [Myxococcota bacterium]